MKKVILDNGMKKVILNNGQVIQGGEQVVDAYLINRQLRRRKKRKKRRQAGQSQPTSKHGVPKSDLFSSPSKGEMDPVFKPEYSGWSSTGCGTNNVASNQLSVICGPTGSLLGPAANSPVATSPLANYGNGSTTGEVLLLPVDNFRDTDTKPDRQDHKVTNSAMPLYVGQSGGFYNGRVTAEQVLPLPKELVPNGPVPMKLA